MQGLILIVVVLALLWLFLIMPQRRKQAAQKQMLEGVEVGDEVLTVGGMYGSVRAIDGDELLIEVAPGTTVRMSRRAVAGIVEPEAEEEEADEEAAPEETADPESDSEPAERR